MPWMIKNHEAINLDTIHKAEVAGGGTNWEVRVWIAEGVYVVDSTHSTEFNAKYRLSNLNSGATYKTPNVRCITSNFNPSLAVFLDGCCLLDVAPSGSQYAAYAVPEGANPGDSGAFLILKMGTEQECINYLTAIYNQWW